MGSHTAQEGCTGESLLGWKSLIKQDGFHPFSHHTCVLRDKMKSLASNFRGNYQWCSLAGEAPSIPYMSIVTLEGWSIIPHGRHFKAVFRVTQPLDIKSVNYLPTHHGKGSHGSEVFLLCTRKHQEGDPHTGRLLPYPLQFVVFTADVCSVCTHPPPV